MLPAPALTRPFTARASVVLPEPDSPTMAKVVPASSVRLTPATAVI